MTKIVRFGGRFAAVTACLAIILSCGDHGAGSGSPTPLNASVGVVTYNIHQGWSPDDDGRVPRWQEMQEVLESCRRPTAVGGESACVLLLQETIRGTDSNRAEVPTDHAGDLRARSFDAVFHSSGGCFAYPGDPAIFRPYEWCGETGLVTATTLRIEETQAITSNVFAARVGGLWYVNAHFAWEQAQGRNDAFFTAEWAKHTLGPIVIGGDLNAAAGYPQLNLLLDAAFQPCAVAGVDHVLIRQAIERESSPETPSTPRPVLACADSWSTPRGLSDHPAVGVVVTVQP